MCTPEFKVIEPETIIHLDTFTGCAELASIVVPHQGARARGRRKHVVGSRTK